MHSVGPNFSHHKARVQAVGWFPLGIRKQGSRPFAAPTPPMVIEVPPLADREWTPNDREWTPNDEYVGIWDPHGNPAGGPPPKQVSR